MSTPRSVQLLALRLTRLGPTGAPVPGATSAWVTKAATTMSMTPNYEEGEEISTTAGDGTICVSYKAPDVLKDFEFSLEICAPEPELDYVLAGGELLSGTGATFTVTNRARATNVATLTTSAPHGLTVGSLVNVAGVDASFNGSSLAVVAVGSSTTLSYANTGADVTSTASSGSLAVSLGTVGWAAPALGSAPDTNGVGIEAWSRAIQDGRPAPVPYFRWVMPLVRTKMDGERTLENGALAKSYAGTGIGNTAFGTGPAEDWPYPTLSPFAYALDANLPSTPGYFPVP